MNNSNVTTLHNEAMVAAERALFCRNRGEADEAAKFFRQAFELESAAAYELRDCFEMEPSRSVLFRSAATLAIDCEEFRQAERLIGFALAGNPPEEILEELRDLLESIYSQPNSMVPASSKSEPT